mmetsp:Transcript_1723/g.5034  ORF Transcript_1723/g.5034 Transcript_1723/m.5034 type:complete len:242 (+) Transcript_1723:2653-3378(+)
MHVGDRSQDLFQDDRHSRLLHLTRCQISTGTVFGDEPNLALDLIHLIQPQNVGMVEGSHHINLIEKLCQLTRLDTGGRYGLAGIFPGKSNGTRALLLPSVALTGRERHISGGGRYRHIVIIGFGSSLQGWRTSRRGLQNTLRLGQMRRGRKFGLWIIRNGGSLSDGILLFFLASSDLFAHGLGHVPHGQLIFAAVLILGLLPTVGLFRGGGSSSSPGLGVVRPTCLLPAFYFVNFSHQTRT